MSKARHPSYLKMPNFGSQDDKYGQGAMVTSEISHDAAFWNQYAEASKDIKESKVTSQISYYALFWNQ